MLENIELADLIPLLLKVVGAIVLFIIIFFVAGWAQRITRRSLEHSKLDRVLLPFFSKLARYAVLVLGILAVLGIFGIPVASFAAILAAAAFAVGMALQGTLSHFASGIRLLTFRPFTVGDAVEVADVSGTVVEIGLFSTVIDTPDNRRLIVPNGSVYGSTIENNTFHDTRRVDVAVGTDYDADLGSTRAALEKVAASVEGGLADPVPVVYLSELGASSINWDVRVWSTTDDYWDVRERLTNSIKEALDAEGIGIPYPQMDVHLENLATSDGEQSDANPIS